MSELFSAQPSPNLTKAPVNGKASPSNASQVNNGIERTLLSDTLIELAPDAIFIATLEGRFIEVNARACQQLGYSREELLSRTIAEIIPPEDLPRLAAVQDVLVRDGSQTQIDTWTHLHRDGSRIPVEVSAKILPDGRWVAFVRDLRDRLQVEGDRNQAQANLQLSETRLKLALQATQSGMWDWDVRNDRAVITEEYCRLMGFDPSLRTVSYEQWLNQIHPDDRPSSGERVARAIQAHEAYVDEYRVLHPDGIRWISSRGQAYYDATGNPIGMVGHLQDVTEQKQTEAALRQKVQEAEAAQQTLNALMEYIPEGITIADAPDVTIRQVSRYGQQLTGRSPEVIEGIPVESHAQNWGIFYADGTTPADNEALPLTRAVQQGEVVTNEEWILRRPDGQQIVMLCNAGPIYNNNGEITGGVIAWRDINDRKQAELALREKEQELQQLCDSMPQFVWVCNAQGELQYINQRWIEYSGLSLAQSRNPQNIADTHHADDIQAVLDHWAIALQTRQPFEMEARLRRAADGAYRWFLIRTVPVLDDQGQVLRWYGTSTDIHDRKLTQLNDQFLSDLDSRLRQLSNADAMAWETVSRVGEYLQVDRCLWHTVDLQAGTTIVQQDWHPADLESVRGKYRLSEYILPQVIDHYQTGQPLVIEDVATHDYTVAVADRFAQLKIQAILGVPWIESGRWVAAFAVNARTVRQWRSDEVALLQEVVSRLWSIIEQTRSAQALQKQEEQTRLATEAAELGMWFWDIPKNELVWTDRSKSIFGMPAAEQLSYEDFLNALHPDDRDRTHAVVLQALEQKSEYDTEYRALWSDGSIHWVAAKGRGFYDANGQPLRMLGTVQDISARKQSELDVQQRSQHIQLLYETTRDLLSTNQPLTLVDSLFAKLKPLIELDVFFNYLLDEERQLLHLRFHGGISGETAQSIEWLEVGRAVCGTVAERQCQIVQPDVQHSTDPKTELIRSLGLTAYSCQPLIAQGKFFGTLGFGSRSRTTFTAAETNLFQAICDQIAIALERSELVVSLQQQTEELRITNQLKDDFFSALSHELRTPLNPILGWTKMLQGQKLTPDRITHALETIERNARHQISLVDDLLDVSRVIGGKLRLDSHPVELVSNIEAAIETVQFAAQAKGIVLQFSHPEAIYTSGDGDRLGQIFWNLLSNAIKFTPEGGAVEIQLSLADGRFSQSAEVRITDTGIGIAPDFLPHIFEYFRQAEGGSTRKYGGLGLGLAIVRHLVELHGGTITAASPGLGQGSTFIVKLPLLGDRLGTGTASDSGATDSMDSNGSDRPGVLPAAQIPFPAAAVPKSGRLSGVQMVLVDDEPDNLELLRFILSEEGATILAFTSPAAALEAIAQSPPNLLVSDIGMPEINGYEFIQQVRALPSPSAKQVPAIAVTAFAQTIDQKRAIAAGYQAYLAKPINPAEVIATITRIVSTA